MIAYDYYTFIWLLSYNFLYMVFDLYLRGKQTNQTNKQIKLSLDWLKDLSLVKITKKISLKSQISP